MRGFSLASAGGLCYNLVKKGGVVMKKLVLIVTVLFLCVNLSSCGIWEELSYSISGEILEPVDGFSRGSEKGTLVFCGNKYILIDELNGEFQFDITKEDILLGQSSNFPFFPASS